MTLVDEFREPDPLRRAIEIAAGVIELLAGATAELTVSDPGLLATYVGPVIDTETLAPLEIHATRMEREEFGPILRGIRSHSTRDLLCGGPPGRGYRGRERFRVWPHAGYPQPRRFNRALHTAALARRQHLCQP